MPTGGRSCWRAAASCRRCGTGFGSAASSRSRPRRSRCPPATKPICTPSRPISPRPAAPHAALSAHLAGIRLQEAAGRRRAADFHLRPCVPQPRARAAAPSRIHHAGMVPGERALRDADGRIAPRSWSEAAKAAGALQLHWKAAPPILLPRRSGLASPTHFRAFAGIDLLATLDGARATATCSRGGARGRHPGRRRRHLVGHFQPRSGRADRAPARPRPADAARPYPLPEAALARPADDPRVAQRFELYACGVELANGFGELTDPAEQRRRFEDAMAEKQRLYGERYPIDEDFLAALGRMPPASGIALGFDRLVMLATGASDRAGAMGAGRRPRSLSRRIDHGARPALGFG